MNKKCINATAYNQTILHRDTLYNIKTILHRDTLYNIKTILHRDTLYNIKRKKCKRVCAELPFFVLS
jgi:ribonuclease HIII